MTVWKESPLASGDDPLLEQNLPPHHIPSNQVAGLSDGCRFRVVNLSDHVQGGSANGRAGSSAAHRLILNKKSNSTKL
jgi:hypothetical protein